MECTPFIEKRGDRQGPHHSADLYDFIGDFALGVGQVGKQHVVVDIHAGVQGFVEKLNRTGAKVIEFDQRGTSGWTFNSYPGANRRMSPGKDAPGLNLPVEPRSADIVFMDLVLQHIRTPSDAIMQIKRILKPGGRLVITDIGKWADRRSPENPCGRWAGVYPGDIRHWLKSAGFSNIIVNPVPTRPYSPDSPQPGIKQPNGYLMATATA